jgi:hypothetical protein
LQEKFELANGELTALRLEFDMLGGTTDIKGVKVFLGSNGQFYQIANGVKGSTTSQQAQNLVSTVEAMNIALAAHIESSSKTETKNTFDYVLTLKPEKTKESILQELGEEVDEKKLNVNSVTVKFSVDKSGNLKSFHSVSSFDFVPEGETEAISVEITTSITVNGSGAAVKIDVADLEAVL